MKKSSSIFAAALLLAVFAAMRLSYPDATKRTLTWDVFGYYAYLPGRFINHDLDSLAWMPAAMKKHGASDRLYQVIPLPDGRRVMKYPIGMAQLFAPFFALGHAAAGWLGFEQDGFSPPYQIAICLGALVFAAVGLWFLRKSLLRFFSEKVAAVALLLLGLATNWPQYVAKDSGMMHGWLFCLYSVFLFWVIKWHERPRIRWAVGLGLVFGLATVARPTEAVMVLVPILWETQNRAASREKWAKVRAKLPHLLWAATACFAAWLPQMAYWKAVTGRWMFDVGSKFTFLNPNWSVLLGWGNGWFVYTPLAAFAVASMFLMKNRPFARAVGWFFFANIWIIIAWSDPKFGATYSCRALVESYPLLALPLGCGVEMLGRRRVWAVGGLVVGAFLVYLNCFQIWQYNRAILHGRDMNGPYYRAIFLNPSPSPLDMSLLDTRERLVSTEGFWEKTVFETDSTFILHAEQRPRNLVLEGKTIDLLPEFQSKKENWLRLRAEVRSEWGAFDSFFKTKLTGCGAEKSTACRMENGISRPGDWNVVEYDFRLPADCAESVVSVELQTSSAQRIEVRRVSVRAFER